MTNRSLAIRDALTLFMSSGHIKWNDKLPGPRILSIRHCLDSEDHGKSVLEQLIQAGYAHYGDDGGYYAGMPVEFGKEHLALKYLLARDTHKGIYRSGWTINQTLLARRYGININDEILDPLVEFGIIDKYQRLQLRNTRRWAGSQDVPARETYDNLSRWMTSCFSTKPGSVIGADFQRIAHANSTTPGSVAILMADLQSEGLITVNRREIRSCIRSKCKGCKKRHDPIQACN